MSNFTGLGVKRISVKKLFGTYDYDIPPASEGKNIDKILILYGSNGAGKTTLLNMLFHLLAIAPSEGHKGFLSKVKFNRFF